MFYDEGSFNAKDLVFQRNSHYTPASYYGKDTLYLSLDLLCELRFAPRFRFACYFARKGISLVATSDLGALPLKTLPPLKRWTKLYLCFAVLITHYALRITHYIYITAPVENILSISSLSCGNSIRSGLASIISLAADCALEISSLSDAISAIFICGRPC